MICCHFFCSAVFSMPVCRNPIVGSSETIVSPSSSRTRRRTPCVLGCCGPMFTVIVSVRISGISVYRTSAKPRSADSPLHQLAHHVQNHPVHFLNPRRLPRGHVHVHVYH